MVLTVRPEAMIETGHSPPRWGRSTTALSDHETRPTHADPQASSVQARSDLTARDGQHAHTPSSQSHTLMVPRVLIRATPS
jgi:hypothetical protein